MNVEKLASFRVDKGSGGYRAIEMTDEEIAARRCFIYGVLRDNPAWNLTPEQVDNVRIYYMGNMRMIEDENYIEHIL